jgi:hypothetical protein
MVQEVVITVSIGASSMKQDLSVVGIDSAKRIFHLVGMDERGKIILRKRLVRGEVISFMAKLPPVTVGMRIGNSVRPGKAGRRELEAAMLP